VTLLDWFQGFKLNFQVSKRWYFDNKTSCIPWANDVCCWILAAQILQSSCIFLLEPGSWNFSFFFVIVYMRFFWTYAGCGICYKLEKWTHILISNSLPSSNTVCFKEVCHTHIVNHCIMWLLNVCVFFLYTVDQLVCKRKCFFHLLLPSLLFTSDYSWKSGPADDEKHSAALVLRLQHLSCEAARQQDHGMHSRLQMLHFKYIVLN
jgi:hypothetical protein